MCNRACVTVLIPGLLVSLRFATSFFSCPVLSSAENPQEENVGILWKKKAFRKDSTFIYALHILAHIPTYTATKAMICGEEFSRFDISGTLFFLFRME